MSHCLKRIDIMIYDKSFKYMVIDDLEFIRNHIECQQADVLAKREYIEEKNIILAVLSQINHIRERFYLNDNEEKFDEQYNKLRQRVLIW